MSISKKARAGIIAGAAIAAVSLTGIAATAANAADSSTSTTTSSSSSTTSRPAHVQEEALTGATADAVKAAVLAKYPGATVNKMETDTDNGAKYEAYITKADGTKAKVLLDANYAITAEKAAPAGKGPDGSGAPGQGHRGHDRGMHRGQNGTQPNGSGDNQGQHRGHHGTPTPSASPAA